MRRALALVCVLCLAATARAGDGFKPLFNGKNLDGWVNVNCAPSTWYVKDDMIITTGKPTGYLRTDRQYENFILEFEWFHAPQKVRDKEIVKKSKDGKGLDIYEINVGNSGMFVWGDPIPAVGTGYTRSIEVQVLVGLRSRVPKSGELAYTSHGDLFSIWGAKCKPDRAHPLGWERCLPSEERAKGEYEWNHYRVEGNNGVLKLSVNGKEVSGVSECNPRKGYLALESEGSECRFKNIKIKELPSTNPKPEEICDVDKGLVSLFTGVDLTHWKASDEHKSHWKMGDGVLSYDGKCDAKDPHLWTDKAYGDFELVLDWRSSSKAEIGLLARTPPNSPLALAGKAGPWNRSIVQVKGGKAIVTTNGTAGTPAEVAPGSVPIGLQHRGESMQFRNVFIRELK
jgi:hypothetical protein